MDAKKMNHAEYQKKVRGMSEAQLRYTIKDAGEAAECGKHIGNPNTGYYLDEVNYCCDELARRARAVA